MNMLLHGSHYNNLPQSLGTCSTTAGLSSFCVEIHVSTTVPNAT